MELLFANTELIVSSGRARFSLHCIISHNVMPKQIVPYKEVSAPFFILQGRACSFTHCIFFLMDLGEANVVVQSGDQST